MTTDALELQHIRTKHALLGVLKVKYDYWETVKVGDVVHAMEAITFEETNYQRVNPRKPKNPSGRYCPNCGVEFEKDEYVCRMCGWDSIRGKEAGK